MFSYFGANRRDFFHFLEQTEGKQKTFALQFNTSILFVFCMLIVVILTIVLSLS